MTKHKTEPVVK